jgi:hypothetical protein
LPQGHLPYGATMIGYPHTAISECPLETNPKLAGDEKEDAILWSKLTRSWEDKKNNQEFANLKSQIVTSRPAGRDRYDAFISMIE